MKPINDVSNNNNKEKNNETSLKIPYTTEN